MSRGLLSFRPASAGMNSVPSHGDRAIYSMEFVVQSASVTDHFSFHVPPPNCRCHSTAICTRHVHFFSNIAAVLIELFLFTHLLKIERNLFFRKI